MTIWHFVVVSALVGVVVGLAIRRTLLALALGSLGGYVILALPNLLTMCSTPSGQPSRAAEEFFWSLVFVPSCFAAGLIAAAASRFVRSALARSSDSQSK